MTAPLTQEQIAALPGLVAEAMEGPWFRNEENDVCIQIDGQYHAVCTDQFCYGSPFEKEANAQLIALAPSLAATVIEQQRIITALSEDASKAAELALALGKIAALEPNEHHSGNRNDNVACRAVRLARAALGYQP